VSPQTGKTSDNETIHPSLTACLVDGARLKRVELILGDCREVMMGMKAESVDAVVTDPPYGIAYQSKNLAPILNDERPYIWWLADAYRITKRPGGLLCFCRWDVQEAFRFAIEIAGFKIRSQVIWDREAHGAGDTKKTFAPQPS
jgi:DNA modification methylase